MEFISCHCLGICLYICISLASHFNANYRPINEKNLNTVFKTTIILKMGLTSPEDIIKEQLKVRKNAHIMLVDGISKLTTHKVNTCQSSVFHVSGHKWKLIVHPAGKDGTKDHLSFHLRIKDKKSLGSKWEVKCSLRLIVVAQTGANMCHSIEWPMVCYNAKQVIHGKDAFMPHKVLKEGYLMNDKAVFCAEVTNVQSKFPVTNLPRTMGTSERLKLTEVPRNKSRFTWKITQFSSFGGEHHSSYEFTAGPRRWKILMYPKGHNDGKGNSLSLFLKACDYVTNGPKAKTLAIYKLRVLDQLHRNHYETNHIRWFLYDPDRPIDCTWGRFKYLPLDELKDSSRGFLVNDQIYIGVEFLLISTTEYL